MKGKRSTDVERQEGDKSKQRDAGEGVDQGCCLGDVAGERCCWKQESDAGASLFDCGGMSCSPFLSLDFIVVVVTQSSKFRRRYLLCRSDLQKLAWPWRRCRLSLAGVTGSSFSSFVVRRRLLAPAHVRHYALRKFVRYIQAEWW